MISALARKASTISLLLDLVPVPEIEDMGSQAQSGAPAIELF
jgi:hypothetical protein